MKKLPNKESICVLLLEKVISIAIIAGLLPFKKLKISRKSDQRVSDVPMNEDLIKKIDVILQGIWYILNSLIDI